MFYVSCLYHSQTIYLCSRPEGRRESGSVKLDSKDTVESYNKYMTVLYHLPLLTQSLILKTNHKRTPVQDVT